jgi:hypothetical protein
VNVAIKLVPSNVTAPPVDARTITAFVDAAPVRVTNFSTPIVGVASVNVPAAVDVTALKP